MAEEKMPAAEATLATSGDERRSYEYAFHVLPTVAEGEVKGVFEDLKNQITKNGGEIFDEEAPERVDFAYPIEKHLEGKNRRYTSGYFGWIRFKLAGESLESLLAELDVHPELLRTLMIKLTRIEEEHPYRYHENRKSVKMVTVVHESSEQIAETLTETESSAVVSEAALEESLEKITGSDETLEAKA